MSCSAWNVGGSFPTGRHGADVVVWAPLASPLYSGEGNVGGAEVQSFTLARSLALAGLRVRHVVATAAPRSAAPDVTPDGGATRGRYLLRIVCKWKNVQEGRTHPSWRWNRAAGTSSVKEE